MRKERPIMSHRRFVPSINPVTSTPPTLEEVRGMIDFFANVNKNIMSIRKNIEEEQLKAKGGK